MRYDFLIDTYASERLKTLNVWSMFDDADLTVAPTRGSTATGRRGSTWFTSA